MLTDHAADLLLAPTEVAMRHLASEGLADSARLVGDVMTDVLSRFARGRRRVGARGTGRACESGGYYLATIHRAENTDDPDRLRGIVVSARRPRPARVLLAHPRVVARAAAAGSS